MAAEKSKIKQVKRFATVFRSFAVADTGEEGYEYLEHLVEYDVRGNVIRETKFLEDGSPEEVNSYSYDASDKLTGHTLEYVPDETSERRAIERDCEGRIVSEQKFYGELSGERTDFEYSENGLVCGIKSYDEEGDFSTREEITYDEKKQMVQRATYDKDNALVEKRELNYAEDGRAVEEKLFGKDGNLQKTTTARRDDQGREVETVERTGQGKLISSVTSVYNEKGNLLERLSKDFNSKILRYTYDEQNRCTGEELFDENGTLLRKLVIELDNDGRVLAEQSYEMNAMRGVRDKHQAIRYEYENYE